MADITNSVNGASSVITNVIMWVTTKLSNFLNGIGGVEIFLGVLIIVAVYFWVQQHNLEPRKVYKF